MLFSLGTVSYASSADVILKDINTYQLDRARSELQKNRLSPEEKRFAEGVLLVYESKYADAVNKLSGLKSFDEFDWEAYARMMREVTKDFITVKSGGFVVRCAPRDRIMTVYLKKILPRIAAGMKKIFGESPRGTVLEIYPDRESFTKASLLSKKELDRSGTVAISKFNRLMILGPRILPYGYNWKDTVCHEYIHKIIGEKTAMHIPLYMNEGLARTFQSLWRESSPHLSASVKSLLAEAKKSGFIEFQKFRRGMPSLENQKQVELAFAEVNYLVYSMYKKKGPKAISSMLDGCGRKGFKKAFEEYFGNYADFINGYWNFLKNNPWQYTGAPADYTYWKKDDVFMEFSIKDFIRLGDRLRAAGDPSLALAQYKKAASLEPENSLVLVKMAKASAGAGDFTGADKYFKKALAVSPGDFVCLSSYAEFLFVNVKYEKCAAVMERALERNPFFKGGYSMLIEVYKRMGNKKKTAEFEKLEKML